MRLASETWVGNSTRLWLFFVLTFAVTWCFWLGAVLLAGESGLSPSLLAGPEGVLLYIGIFAPAFVAVSLTALYDGREGVRALLSRLFQWEVPARWYVFAVGYMAGVRLVTAGLYRIATGAWPTFDFEVWYLMLLATAASTVIGGQAGEELGWRGYALPRLAARIGLRWASVVLGLFWALWHLPLFYVSGPDTSGQSFPLYAVQVVGLSVAIAWLYSHTGGSLLLTMLMHAAINNTKDIVPGIPRPWANPMLPGAPLLGWLGAAVISVTAIWFLVRMPKLPESEGYER